MKPVEEMTPEEREAEIAEHNKRLAVLRSGFGEADRKPEVTVCIPVGPGNMRWLWNAVYSIEKGCQSEPVNLHMTAQANTNAAKAALDAQQKTWRNEWKVADYRYLGEVPNLGKKLYNLCESRKTLAQSVETPYLLWLDADVFMPRGGVRILLDWIKEHPDHGFVGLQYTDRVDHVQNGCTIMPTDLAKRLTWAPARCSCYQACKEIVDLGYKVAHVPGLYAIHMPEERG